MIAVFYMSNPTHHGSLSIQELAITIHSIYQHYLSHVSNQLSYHINTLYDQLNLTTVTTPTMSTMWKYVIYTSTQTLRPHTGVYFLPDLLPATQMNFHPYSFELQEINQQEVDLCMWPIEHYCYPNHHSPFPISPPQITIVHHPHLTPASYHLCLPREVLLYSLQEGLGAVIGQLSQHGLIKAYSHGRPHTLQCLEQVLSLVCISAGEHHQVVLVVYRGDELSSSHLT